MPLYPIIRRRRLVRGAERLRSRRVVPLVTEVVHSSAEVRGLVGDASPAEIQAAMRAAAQAGRIVGKPFRKKG
jgi:hypothetical protein